MTGSIRSAAAALTVVALLAGCSTVVKEPEVRLDGIRLGGIGFQGGLLYVRVSIYNPNGFDLEADELSYDLDFSRPAGGDTTWIDVADGVYDEELRVAGHDSATVEIPIEFDYDELGGALRAILDRGSIGYRVSGAVQVDRPIDREIPYRKRGTVSLSGVR